MTTGNANLEDLTDDELEAAQRLADGEAEGTNPDVKTEAEAAEKATEATATETTEAAAAPAVGAEVSEAEPAAKVEGIASKDGSRILPYAALQAERRNARTANARYEATARELEEAKQLIADMKAGKTPDTGEVTEADVAQMEEDFPEQGKKMRALFERAQAAAAAAPAKTASAEHDVGDDPVQDAIDQVPLLVEWQTGDAEKFQRAQEHDRVLVNSPKWANKSAVERFTHVAKLVADEYDIPFPVAKTSDAKPTPSPAKTAADAAERATPNTLSDFKGGAIPDHGTVNVKNMSPQALLGRYEGMTDAEIDAELARLG
jgi:hypothetical protein